MKKGGSCPKCGYMIRKWAIRCPICRSSLHLVTKEDERHALVDLAKRHLRKLEEKESEIRALV